MLSAYQTIINNVDDINNKETVSLGSGDAVSIEQLVLKIAKLSGSSSELNFGAVPERENEPQLSVADITRLEHFSWKPKYQLESGLAELILESTQD